MNDIDESKHTKSLGIIHVKFYSEHIYWKIKYKDDNCGEYVAIFRSYLESPSLIRFLLPITKKVL